MSAPEAKDSYRKAVQRYVKSGQISPEDRDYLADYRSHLRLRASEAEAIEREVLSALGSPERSQAPLQNQPSPSSQSDYAAKTSIASPTLGSQQSNASLPQSAQAEQPNRGIHQSYEPPRSTQVDQPDVNMATSSSATEQSFNQTATGQTATGQTATGQTATGQTVFGQTTLGTTRLSSSLGEQSTSEQVASSPTIEHSTASSATPSLMVLPTEMPDGSSTLPEFSNSSSESSTEATTVIPPQQPENYFSHLHQYEEAFLQAFRTEGFNPSEETRNRLRSLAKQWDLNGTDVAAAEREILVKYCLTSQPPDVASPEVAAVPVTLPPTDPDVPIVLPPPPPEEKYDPKLEPLFEELEASLKLKEFRNADEKTFEILQALFTPLPWIDPATIRNFSPSDLEKGAMQTIDQLWQDYSQQKFGFSRQLNLYGQASSQLTMLENRPREHRIQALNFCRTVNWWIDGLEFFKYYWMLDFTPEAPEAHLPARWFWELPQQKSFWQGGFAKTRGGCRIDDFTLPAFMYVLESCGIYSQLLT